MTDSKREDGSAVADVFDNAREAVLDDRGETHGGIHDNFNQTARLWSNYLGVGVSSVDVAVMMVMLKASRQKCGSTDPDHYTDMAGYAAIANGLANPREELESDGG